MYMCAEQENEENDRFKTFDDYAYALCPEGNYCVQSGLMMMING